MDFDWWFSKATCSRHAGTDAATACPRCGAFCCPDCLAKDSPLCQPCYVIAMREARTALARSVALKLGVAPVLILIACLMLLERRHGVPGIFALWLMPLVCAIWLARTERAGLAWLGALASLAIVAWLATGLLGSEQWGELIDLAFLSIAPLISVPGCARLSRACMQLRLAELSV